VICLILSNNDLNKIKHQQLTILKLEYTTGQTDRQARHVIWLIRMTIQHCQNAKPAANTIQTCMLMAKSSIRTHQLYSYQIYALSRGTSSNLTAASGWQLLRYWTLGYGKPLRAYGSVKMLRCVTV